MNGNSGRLEELATRHAAAVIGYLVRRCPVREDAADLYQRVLLTTWRRIGSVPGDDDAARCWMLAVARRELANARRGEQRRGVATAALRHELAARAGDPAAEADPGLHEALAELPTADRELLLLTYWDGLSSDQAAAVLGIAAPAARKRLQRARDRLARHPALVHHPALDGQRALATPRP